MISSAQLFRDDCSEDRNYLEFVFSEGVGF